MVEVIGDVVAPSEFILPQKTTAELNAISGVGPISGLMFLNHTTGDIEIYISGVGMNTISVTAR